MHLRDELHIGKPLAPGQEMALAVLLTREHVVRLFDERIFKPSGLTEPQYNILRILKGGPQAGYLIGEIRRRMIARKADVPRLVDRLAARGWVRRTADAVDRRGCRVQLTAEGEALHRELVEPTQALHAALSNALAPAEQELLIDLLERLRDEVLRLLD